MYDPTGGDGFIRDPEWREIEQSLIRGDITDEEYEQLAREDSEYCRRCGGPNVIWSAASPLWNYVMRGNDINGDSRYSDLVCIACFIRCAVEAGLPETGWRLTLIPEPEGLVYETPSGRVWDPERFLWVEE